MSELERIQRYIARTGMNKNGKCCLMLQDTVALLHKGLASEDDLFETILLAFDYGRAKGYRAARREAKG